MSATLRSIGNSRAGNAPGAQKRSNAEGHHSEAEDRGEHKTAGALRVRVHCAIKLNGFEHGGDAKGEKSHANHLIPNDACGLDHVRNNFARKPLSIGRNGFHNLLCLAEIHHTFMLAHRADRGPGNETDSSRHLLNGC